jgi:hypothetical protein
MKNESLEVKQAISNIGLLRQVLNEADRALSDTNVVGSTLNAHLLLQIIAFVTAIGLLLTEFFTGNSMSETLLSGNKDAQLASFGIGFMGFILAGFLLVLYFIVWRAAKHSGEDMAAYIARHFKYMRQLSLISDVLMKFIAISLLMLAGKQIWIAPLLMAFTGDYLLQSRLFTIPTKLSIALGVVCIGLAFYQFSSQTGLLIFPLAVFAIVTCISCTRLALRYRKQALLDL